MIADVTRSLDAADVAAHGRPRIFRQIASAHAAKRRRRERARWAARSTASNPAQPRAYLALAVALGLVDADALLDRLHRRGRGM